MPEALSRAAPSSLPPFFRLEQSFRTVIHTPRPRPPPLLQHTNTPTHSPPPKTKLFPKSLPFRERRESFTTHSVRDGGRLQSLRACVWFASGFLFFFFGGGVGVISIERPHRAHTLWTGYSWRSAIFSINRGQVVAPPPLPFRYISIALFCFRRSFEKPAAAEHAHSNGRGGRG